MKTLRSLLHDPPRRMRDATELAPGGNYALNTLFRSRSQAGGPGQYQQGADSKQKPFSPPNTIKTSNNNRSLAPPVMTKLNLIRIFFPFIFFSESLLISNKSIKRPQISYGFLDIFISKIFSFFPSRSLNASSIHIPSSIFKLTSIAKPIFHRKPLAIGKISYF